MIPKSTPAFMVWRNNETVAIVRADLGGPLALLLFLSEAEAEEMALTCDGEVYQSTVGEFAQAAEGLDLPLAMKDETGTHHYIRREEGNVRRI